MVDNVVAVRWSARLVDGVQLEQDGREDAVTETSIENIWRRAATRSAYQREKIGAR